MFEVNVEVRWIVVGDKVIDIRWPPSLWPSTSAFMVAMVEVRVEV